MSDKPFSCPVDINDFMKINFPKDQSLWGKGLLDKNSMLFISGPSKIGKSCLALNLSICLAQGKSFLGFGIPKKKKVLYIQQEICKYSLQERLGLMLRAKQEKIKDGYLMLQCIKMCNITDESHFKQIREWVQMSGCDVVIFDPLYRFHSLDENAANQMKDLLSMFDSLIDDFNISVIIIHHHNKYANKNTRASSSLRGSGVLIGWGDSYLILDYYNDRDNEMKITWELRNAANPKDLYILRDRNLWYEQIIPKQEGNYLEILNLIKSVGGKRVQEKTLKELAMTKLGMKYRSLRSHLKQMAKTSIIEFSKEERKKFWSLINATAR